MVTDLYLEGSELNKTTIYFGKYEVYHKLRNFKKGTALSLYRCVCVSFKLFFRT